MKITQVCASNPFFTTDGPFPSNFVYYSEFVQKLAKPMGDLDSLHAVVGISGEAGELLDAIKKNWAYGKPLDLLNVVEELGDLRFYMQHLMNTLGISEQEVIQHNVEKLSKRYAEGYSDKAAQARADKRESEDAEAEFDAMAAFAAPTPVDPEQVCLTAVPFGYQINKNNPDWSAS